MSFSAEIRLPLPAAPGFGPLGGWRLLAALFGVGRARTGAGEASAMSGADERRFRELMLPHLDACYNFARCLLRDQAAAEDVVQEAYLRAFRAFPGYRGGEPKAWLLSIVRNCAFTWSKAERGRAQVVVSSLDFGRPDGAPAPEPRDPDQETPEAALVRRGEIAAVREAVAALPEPYRETLVLRELEELSYKEIAAVTSAPIGTVMSRLARARALLAEALKPEEGCA
jgi:RNA polymerase sigma-70 factor (ECF subfamily)